MKQKYNTLPDFIKVVKYCNDHYEYTCECPECKVKYIIWVTTSTHDKFLSYCNCLKSTTYNPLLPKPNLWQLMRNTKPKFIRMLLTGKCTSCLEKHE